MGLPPPSTECIDWPAEAGACPTDEAIILFSLDVNACTNDLTESVEASYVLSPPSPGANGQCCYLVS